MKAQYISAIFASSLTRRYPSHQCSNFPVRLTQQLQIASFKYFAILSNSSSINATLAKLSFLYFLKINKFTKVPTMMKKMTVTLGCLLAGALPALSHADPGDEICFPLYRDNGAIPLTQQCPTLASTASFGLGNYYCANLSTYIARYCGQVLRNSCNSNVGHPIDTSNGNKHLRENDYTGTGLHPLVFERYYNSSPGQTRLARWTLSGVRILIAACG